MGLTPDTRHYPLLFPCLEVQLSTVDERRAETTTERGPGETIDAELKSGIGYLYCRRKIKKES